MTFRTIILFAVICVSSFQLWAQMPVFKLSQRAVVKIERIKSAEQKLKRYKRYFHRDSARYDKQLKRYYKHYSDSLREALNSGYASRKKEFSEIKIDSSTELSVVVDSLAVIDEPLKIRSANILKDQIPDKIDQASFIKVSDDIQNQYNTYTSLLPSTDSLKAGLLDSPSLNDFVPEDRLKEFNNIKQLSDTAAIKAKIKKEAEELAMKYITETPASLQGAQRKMALLMRKYSVVPNSTDLSTAIKRTSLAGRSFKERLYVAGNFQTPSLDPLCVDFTPLIGYRFNRNLIGGVGGNYRQSFGDSIPTLANAVWGYKIFMSYDVISNFFAYGELGRNSPGVKVLEGETNREWRTAALIGVGRKFMVRPKLETTILMLYNFTYKQGDPIFPRPWVIRVGFQTSISAFKN